MQITVDIPDDLVIRLGERSLSQVLELGLSELNARPRSGFGGFAEVVEFLAGLPTPQEILALRPSDNLQAHINSLSEKYQLQTLTSEELQLWQQYEYLEHVVRMAKAKAYLKLDEQVAK